MKKLLISLGLCVALVGCTTNQITVAYKTLYSVEHVTVSTYDGYLDSVVKGQTSTNSVPKVSKAFNDFQASYIVALDAAEFNTNALAPSSLLQESTDIITLINTVKGH